MSLYQLILNTKDSKEKKECLQLQIGKLFGKDWKVGNISTPSGQSITCDLFNKQAAKLKIFNLSKRNNSEERYLRELEILKATTDEPNVVSLIDYETTNGILILEKGIPLIEHWKNTKKQDPQFRLNNALAIIIDLAKGLASCHIKGYSHRDIKPANVIKVGSSFKLIDFGIALDIYGERITLPDETIGNIKTSPYPGALDKDVDFFRYDIFQLNQVFLWLIAEKKDTTWNRPIDWRFLDLRNYPPSDALKIQALSALASDLMTGIENGQSFLKLINSLFDLSYDVPSLPKAMNKVLSSLQEGTSKALIAGEEERSLIEKHWPNFKYLCSSLESALIDLRKSYKSIIVDGSAKFEIEQIFQIANKLVLSNNEREGGGQHKAYNLICGNQTLNYEINIYVCYKKASLKRRKMELYHEGMSPFELNIFRETIHNTAETIPLRKNRIYTHNSAGTLLEFQAGHLFKAQHYGTVGLQDIVKLIESYLNDSNYVSLLSK